MLAKKVKVLPSWCECYRVVWNKKHAVQSNCWKFVNHTLCYFHQQWVLFHSKGITDSYWHIQCGQVQKLVSVARTILNWLIVHHPFIISRCILLQKDDKKPCHVLTQAPIHVGTYIEHHGTTCTCTWIHGGCTTYCIVLFTVDSGVWNYVCYIYWSWHNIVQILDCIKMQ